MVIREFGVTLLLLVGIRALDAFFGLDPAWLLVTFYVWNVVCEAFEESQKHGRGKG